MRNLAYIVKCHEDSYRVYLPSKELLAHFEAFRPAMDYVHIWISEYLDNFNPYLDKVKFYTAVLHNNTINLYNSQDRKAGRGIVLNDDKWGLERCPECRTDNFVIAVPSGICSWCGFNINKPIARYILNDDDDTRKTSK